MSDATWALTEGIRRNLPFPADPSKRPAAERSTASGEYVDYQSREMSPEVQAAELDMVMSQRLPLPKFDRH